MNRALGVTIGTAVVGVAVILAAVFLAGPTMATVSFHETGLPAGHSWFVTIDNVTHASPLDTISVSLQPGTYPYAISLAGTTEYAAYPGNGTLVLTSAGATLNITFVRAAANLTLQETGLPTGSQWTVAEGAAYHDSNSTSLQIHVTNGLHVFRVLVASTISVDTRGPEWIDIDLYLANLTRLAVAVNGSDVSMALSFTPLLHLNTTAFPQYVFANDTGPGAPAYEYLALTPTRYMTANLSFDSPPVGNIPQNSTGYLMNATQFDAFARTASTRDYLLTTGNVSRAELSVNLGPGTWYFLVTGWGVSEFNPVSLSYYITFPGTDAIFT